MRTESRHLPGACIGLLIIWTILLAPRLSAAETQRALSLRESIAIALKQSVLIHAANEGVRGAEAQQKEAFTGFLPKFSASYSYTRLNTDPTVTTPGTSLTLPPPIGSATMPPATYQAGTKDNYNWAIEARQPLFAGGGILANYEASRLAVDITRLEETAVVQDLVQEVKVAYYSILKAVRLLDVAKQSVERLKAHREMAQGFYDVGMIPKNDLLYAEVELASGHQLLLRAENGVEIAKARFNSVLRREINSPVEIEDRLPESALTAPLDACIMSALKSRPEIRSTLKRVEQARSIVKLIKSEYYPSIGMVGNYARYGDTPGVAGSPYKSQENWYVLAVANWNFWEWGKTKYKVDASLSRENQAADILANIQDQISLDVKNAFLLHREAEKKIQVTKRAIEQAEENFRINTERYREQVGTSTDVIDAQTLLTKTRSDHYNALGDLNISRARLERAMGESPTGNQ
jgi:outer membrane protein